MKDLNLTTFHDLGLGAPLMQALDEEGYTQPTPIQAKAIPGVLAGRDLLGIAQTGTGKTAAFALPILERLAADRRPAPRRGCRVLVLSPTRELATQIGESFKTYGRHLGLSVTVVFGGVAHRPQIQALARGVDVLVATPGRLIDHMDEKNVALESTEIFVLDEADQMLDLGFVRPIRRIVSKLSMKRQSLFFSATMPHEIGALAAELLREPVRVSVAPSATTIELVSQRVIHVEQNRKRSLLVELLGDPAMSRTLVFTRTKRGADRVARHLETAGIGVAAIHGNKSQGQREAALAAFKASEIRVLVATDIAARGIDIDLVTHVVNFELPDVPESYVHRIGRTARAGAEGIAISLVDAEERTQLRDIERVSRQQIPTEDRRNDGRLTADAKGSGSGRDTDRPRRGREGGGGGRGRDNRSAERNTRGAGNRQARRPAHGDRPERSERTDRPWDNHAPAERSGGERASTDRPRSTPSRGDRGAPTHADPRRGEPQRGEQRRSDADRRPRSEARPAESRDHRKPNGGHDSRKPAENRNSDSRRAAPESRHGERTERPRTSEGHRDQDRRPDKRGPEQRRPEKRSTEKRGPERGDSPARPRPSSPIRFGERTR